MPNLEEVNRPEGVALQQRRLDRRLGVPGEQRGEFAMSEHDDDRPVVDVAIGKRLGRLIGCRIENPQRGRRVEGEPLAGACQAHRNPFARCLGQQPIVGGVLEGNPGMEDGADREALGNLDEPGDVVLVWMCEQDDVDPTREERQVRADAPEGELRIGTAVDEHGRAAGCLNEDRVALADIQYGHVELPVGPGRDGNRQEERDERGENGDRPQDVVGGSRERARPARPGRRRSRPRRAHRPRAEREHREPCDGEGVRDGNRDRRVRD